jgi:hypothetical protein
MEMEGPGGAESGPHQLPIPFARLVHADWSKTPAKRWAVEARRTSTGWLVKAPQLVGSVANFVSGLLDVPQPTLAGFDFPIGLPAAFGEKTEFSGFIGAIEAFGVDKWSRFYEVSESADDISLHRLLSARIILRGASSTSSESAGVR